MHGKPRHEGLSRRAVLAAAVLVPGACVAERRGGFLPIATAEVDGVYFRIGNAIAERINLGYKGHGLRAAAQSSPGSFANVAALLRRRTALGLIQSNDAWSLDAAHRGELRLLAALHAESFVLLARPEIGSPDALPGHPVALGPPGSGHRTAMTALMAGRGWTPGDFTQTREHTTRSSLAALCAGVVDAVPLMIGHPAPAVGRVVDRCGARPLALSDADRAAFGNHAPGFEPAVIPAGMYGTGTPAVPTVGTRVLLACHAGLSGAAAAAAVASLLNGIEALRAAHPVLRAVTARSLRPPVDGPVALHDGARRAYAEAGVA
ncbi:TAXI family TRAP transporter solute-binding subunit [Azospirillum halopraeferens]|uniref:TAXI family TRAP transporter solute-binding subunit n=1 Tax=Azospirillum halopraeferens TaxID=34010 RepID=UPI00041DF165|nr:TAXI family TRAP transporter solute-binding subunit [Azospirillum halopraeferens]